MRRENQNQVVISENEEDRIGYLRKGRDQVEEAYAMFRNSNLGGHELRPWKWIVAMVG